MSRQFTIQRGSTLSKIALDFYGDAALFKKLADFNGLRDPNAISIGQVIEVPSKKELLGVAPVPEVEMPPGLITPNGLDEIIMTFGNIYNFINADGNLSPGWETRFLTRTQLPFSIPLSWNESQSISKLFCHVKLAKMFSQVFTAIQDEGLRSHIKTFGGCYNYRPKRTSGKLSAHSWGIAIDLNSNTNLQGTPGNMHPGVIDIFRSFGFKWGGDWSGKTKDPMHFQFCTGY